MASRGSPTVRRSRSRSEGGVIHYVSGRDSALLGIPMHLGRGFTAAADRADVTTLQVVINHHLWQDALGSPADIIGRAIQLNNMMFSVIALRDD